MTADRLVLTGQILTFTGDPGADPAATVHLADGAVAVEAGKIVWVGERADLPDVWASGAARHDYGGDLILPGFVDGLVHYPQIGVVASFGAQLLEGDGAVGIEHIARGWLLSVPAFSVVSRCSTTGIACHIAFQAPSFWAN